MTTAPRTIPTRIASTGKPGIPGPEVPGTWNVVELIVATDVTVTNWIELVVDSVVVLVVEVDVEFDTIRLSDCIVVVEVVETVVEIVVEAVCALIGTLNEETRTATAMTMSTAGIALRGDGRINFNHLLSITCFTTPNQSDHGYPE
jgi:hypothetical protein